jgi:hypothetical protein
MTGEKSQSFKLRVGEENGNRCDPKNYDQDRGYCTLESVVAVNLMGILYFHFIQLN